MRESERIQPAKPTAKIRRSSKRSYGKKGKKGRGTTIHLYIGDEKVRQYGLQLATSPDAVDWYAFFTMEQYKGKSATVTVNRATEACFALIRQADMVPGAEDMRTSVKQTIELEKEVRGVTAGFNTPLFVTDAPGGGGKRDVHSYDYYDETSGISVYRN